jgi:hypothetical protein
MHRVIYFEIPGVLAYVNYLFVKRAMGFGLAITSMKINNHTPATATY